MVHTLAMSDETIGIVVGVSFAAVVMIYFGVRYWLVSTRPAALQDVKTPHVDRLNRSALEHMAAETQEEDEAETEALESEDSPADLKAAVVEETGGAAGDLRK